MGQCSGSLLPIPTTLPSSSYKPQPLPQNVRQRVMRFTADCNTMRQRLNSSKKHIFPSDFHLPSRTPSSSKSQKSGPESVYDAWLKSREMPNQKGAYLVPGAPRPLTLENFHLACYVSRTCIFDLVRFSAFQRVAACLILFSSRRCGDCIHCVRRSWCRSTSSGVCSPHSEVIPRCATPCPSFERNPDDGRTGSHHRRGISLVT